MSVRDKLFDLGDENYASFHGKLIPNIPAGKIIGVRVPLLRKLAKQIRNSDEANCFLSELPHKYYDEDMLHAMLISEIRNYDDCIEELERFLPFVDNWAVCDCMIPSVFKKREHEVELLEIIKEWVSSQDTYTCRFGIKMLMTYYLDERFLPDYLCIPLSVHSNEYYVKMMIAWYYATALAKQWDSATAVIESYQLEKWIHNKAIQKAVESRRLTKQQKDYLKGLKVR